MLIQITEYWVDNITEEDLNTLPIILLGLSDIKLFPIPTTEVAKKLTSNFPHIQFFNSKITGRKLAAGTTKFNTTVTGINRKPINIIWNYQLIKDDQAIEQTKEIAIEVNYNLTQMENNDTNEFTLEIDQIQSLSDIKNHSGTDIESKNLIESIMTKDMKEHQGKDEATLCLAQQLQKDYDNEVKQENPESFKYDENEFPPLTK